MSDPSTSPIVVHGSPGRPQIEAGIRQFITAIGPLVGLLGATGWGAKLGLSTTSTFSV